MAARFGACQRAGEHPRAHDVPPDHAHEVALFGTERGAVEDQAERFVAADLDGGFARRITGPLGAREAL